MTHYKTHITDEALNDMESIYEYIARNFLLRTPQWDNIIVSLTP